MYMLLPLSNICLYINMNMYTFTCCYPWSICIYTYIYICIYVYIVTPEQYISIYTYIYVYVANSEHIWCSTWAIPFRVQVWNTYSYLYLYWVESIVATPLYYGAECSAVLQNIAVCCSVLQIVIVCSTGGWCARCHVLQRREVANSHP